MTRRGFVSMAVAAAVRPAAPARLPVPLHRIVDSRLENSARVQHFWPNLWNEAVRDYGQGNLTFDSSDGPGEVKQSPGDNPIFMGLQRGKINLVVTDTVPMYWDGGRALADVSTIHDGYQISMIGLRYAHRNQIAFLSVNTCLHEILHVLLQDIFLKAPKWYQTGGREARVDYYATRLWLFHDGDEVRKSGEEYLGRLRAGIAHPA
jgi:hypothetical protein